MIKEDVLNSFVGLNCLVTGGTGFLGSHLLERVQSMGWDVTSVSLHPPTTARQAKGVRYLHFDITDVEEVKRHFSDDFEYVVNLGGYIDHTLFFYEFFYENYSVCFLTSIEALCPPKPNVLLKA